MELTIVTPPEATTRGAAAARERAPRNSNPYASGRERRQWFRAFDFTEQQLDAAYRRALSVLSDHEDQHVRDGHRVG